MGSRFESVSSQHYDMVVSHKITIDGYPISVERQGDWTTAINWRLPDEYSWEDFLTAMEETYELAEECGYPFEDLTPVAIGSPDRDKLFEGEFDRPLTTDDIEGLDLSLDRVSFIRTGGDLANFYLDRARLVGVIYDQSPHSIRTADAFMRKMLPSNIDIDAEEIVKYVEGLERAPDQIIDHDGTMHTFE